MENPDILSIIVRKRSIMDNIKNCTVNRSFYNICMKILEDQVYILYYFNRIKRRSVFPKKRNRIDRTYYTMKNRYINKEDTPILTFFNNLQMI